MGHFPINHHLRPLYRVLAGLTGAFILVLGVLGYIESRDLDLFARENVPWVFGLRINPAFALLSIVSGIVMVLATLIGRNVDRLVNWIAGIGFMLVGTAMLTFLQTDANILAFSMTNVIVSYIFGIVTLTAGMYGKVGSAEDADAEDAFRHR